MKGFWKNRKQLTKLTDYKPLFVMPWKKTWHSREILSNCYVHELMSWGLEKSKAWNLQIDYGWSYTEHESQTNCWYRSWSSSYMWCFNYLEVVCDHRTCHVLELGFGMILVNGEYCWWGGQGMRSGGQGTGAGWAIKVGISSPGIKTEYSWALAEICINKVVWFICKFKKWRLKCCTIKAEVW